ncbi:MAG: hypothetical protein E6R03_13835 [Hyphomicrobiaceae bacterium]|nr:MAG: hypothetical protein E6R03_13835 [Hyphomicrobiaceae bacterium]
MTDKPKKRGPGRPPVEGRKPKDGKPIFPIRLDDEDREWVKQHGGSEYIRRLIHDDRERRKNS